MMEPMLLRHLLQNSAEEITRLSRVAQQLDDLLGDMPHDAMPHQMSALQNMDMLRQSLESMGAYVASLAEEVDGDARINPQVAASQIKLRDLRAACLAGSGG